MKPELLFDLFNRARSEEMGLVIETNNPHGLECKISDALKGSNLYPDIMLVIPSTPNTVILVKKSVELNEDPWAGTEGDLPDV